MSKYGNGISMKSMIEMEIQEVTEILDKYKINEEDREVVLDALKEMAYQWCDCNANARAYQMAVPYKGNPMMLVMSRIYNEEYTKSMKDTCPF